MPTDSTDHRFCRSLSSCLWQVTMHARLVVLWVHDWQWSWQKISEFWTDCCTNSLITHKVPAPINKDILKLSDLVTGWANWIPLRYGTAQFKLDTRSRVLSPSLEKSVEKLAILSRVARERFNKVSIVTSNMHVRCTRVHSRADVTCETSTRVVAQTSLLGFLASVHSSIL